MSDKRLGELLVHTKLLDRDILQKVLAEQKRLSTHMPLGKMLLQKKLVEEGALLDNIPKKKFYPRLSQAKVLIMEDITVMRLVQERMLKKIATEVSSVKNGQTGLEYLSQALTAKKPYQLLVLDLMMPRIGGQKVLARLQKINPVLKPAVLVVTAKSEKQSVIECAHLGAEKYMVKPFTTFQLLEFSEEVLAIAGKFEPENRQNC